MTAATEPLATEAGDRSTRIARGLGWSLTGNLVLRVGNLLVGILMARLIAPEQFGVFAVALTVWTILSTLAEFGLGSDLVRAEDVERRAPTVATLALATSGTLALSMALAAAPIAAGFRSPDSEGVIRLMAVSVALFGLTVVPTARLHRAFRQRAVFVVNAVALLASVLTMTTLAINDVGPAALAWGQIACQLGIVVMAHLATRTVPRFGFDRSVAGDSIAFCAPLAFANLLSWALLSIDNLVVARVLGPAQLGLYVIAFNVSSWPMNAIGQSVRVVALPAFSQLRDPELRNRSLVGCAGPTIAVATLAAIVFSTLAGPLAVALFGARWAEAAPALVGLAVFGGVRVVLDLLATFLVAAGATAEVLAVQLGWLAAMVPAMYVGVSRFGLAGAGWAHAIVAVLVVLPLYAVCLRRTGVDVARFLRGGLVPVLSAAPAVVLCWWVGQRDANPWLLLAAGGAVALAAYALPLSRWWLRSVNELRRPPVGALEES